MTFEINREAIDMRIRAATEADIPSLARVHVDSWRSTYAGIVPDEYLSDLSYRDRESFWEAVLTTARPGISNFVAETPSGDVVGMAGGGPERSGSETYHGELYLVYLLAEYQRRGLGRRLVSAVAGKLLADGTDSMMVGVLEDNRPACRFYQTLGGERVDRRTVSIGGSDLVEVFYGWRDITMLTEGSREPC